mgnify:CR=1 FL=1
MFLQLAIGSLLMVASILIAGLAYWALEALLSRSRPWLMRDPHRPKLALVMTVTVLWVLGMVTIGVWLWAVTLRFLDVFITMEASVYFSLVAFTTLGFGDILLPQEWRLLAGLACLREQPEVDSNQTAAIGFCFGGLSVLDLARTGADIAAEM